MEVHTVRGHFLFDTVRCDFRSGRSTDAGPHRHVHTNTECASDGDIEYHISDCCYEQALREYGGIYKTTEALIHPCLYADLNFTDALEIRVTLRTLQKVCSTPHNQSLCISHDHRV